MQNAINAYGSSTFIGETIIGLPYPVFFTPHYPMKINRPPVSLITGSSGSGKTFFGLILASHASILGGKGIVLDPKRDFTCLVKLKKAGYIQDVQIWAIFNKDGEVEIENEGMLDPTVFTDDPKENANITMNIIKTLIGEKDITPKQKNSIIPIVQDVTEKKSNASFAVLVKKIMSNQDDEVRSLGTQLNLYLNTPVAKLLVANKRIKKKQLDLKKGFVVADLMGLKLPPETLPSEEYSIEQRISVGIMGLLTKLVYNLMTKEDTTTYKTLIIDEAWSVMATSDGRALIQEVGRFGRRFNLATILMTQSPTHLETENTTDMDTHISCRFAFRNNNMNDNIITCNAMGLQEGGWETIISKLETGECLMQDVFGNINVVHIMTQDDWAEMFDTNPNNELIRKRLETVLE